MKSSALTLIVFTLCLAMATAAQTLETKLTGIDRRHKGESFPLDQAKLEIELAGPVAATSWELRFRNNSIRQAEGELEVPLRSGCKVTGYAMDVSGYMREGVVVDAQRARRAYEEIVSRRVDPGILETSALGFKTKVFPIPANGTKSIRVDLSEIRLTGDWQPPLPGANQLKIDWKIICRDKNAPAITGVKAKWIKQHNHWMALGNNTLFELQQLKLSPKLPAHRWLATPDANQIKIVGTIPTGDTQQARTTPKHIHLWWDGSLGGRDRNRESVIESLRHLTQWIKEGTLTLHIFRDKTSNAEPFQIKAGDCEPLWQRLRKEPTEGMVRFDALTDSGNDAMTVVVSEGASPLPSIAPQFKPSTRWTLLDPSGQSGQSLGAFALKSGNEVRKLLDHEWQIIHRCNSPIVKNHTLKKVGNQWIITGEISPGGLMKLKGGVARSEIGRPIWAIETYRQMCLEGKPTKQTLEFAKGEKVLSKQTAFIVLDSINDYVRYGIEPPEKILRETWLSKTKGVKQKNDATLADWTRQWKLWQDQSQTQPSDYGERLTKAIAETCLLWAKHIGQGEDKIKPEEMTQIIGFQAKVDRLTHAKESIQRLKGLAAIQQKWAELKTKVRGRIGIMGITVGGFVRNPGPVQLPLRAGLQQAVEAAGGATAFGSIRRVELFRKGKRLVYDLRKKGPQDIPLQDNDSVNVPHKPWLSNGGGSPGQTPPFELANKSAWLKGNIKRSKSAWLKGSIKRGKWSSDRPYVKVLQKILKSGSDWKPVYQAQTEVYGWRADYYLDIIDLLEQHNLGEAAKPLAKNVAQLETNSPELLRRSARALNRLGASQLAGELFQRITELAPDEPTSWIDLARWHHRQGDLNAAIENYAKVTESHWPSRWRSTWTTAMIELNGILNLKGKKLAEGKIHPTRITPISADLRVILDWDAARSNVDLWVNDPLGELVSWGNLKGNGGGRIASDAISGYGSEEYFIRHAMPGDYQIHAKYHSDWDQHNIATVSVEAQIILNFGRENESRQIISLRIPEQKLINLGSVKWEIQD